MSILAQLVRNGGVATVLALASWVSAKPSLAFCVRNDTGAPILVEALDDTAAFTAKIANNKKACCRPKDDACAIDDSDVQLSITASEDDGACSVTVDPKGNVNVTGKQHALICKANKAGSTMDWAPG